MNFIPVVFCDGCNGWRRLTGDEYHCLSNPARQPAKPDRMRSWLVALLRAALSVVLGVGMEERIRRRIRRILARTNHPASHAGLVVDLYQPGSVFLDLDGAWHSPVDRAKLLPALRASGVHIATLHYDIIPLLFPRLVHPRTVRLFKRYFEAHVKHSELFICISEHAVQELKNYCSTSHPGVAVNTATVQLGADFAAPPELKDKPTLPPQVGRYLLSVGTVEPRKNYHLLIDAFDAIAGRFDDVSLVIVGRRGWKSRDIARRIRNHPLVGKRLFWLQGVSDGGLGELYRCATLCVVPSLYEGYGLPVIESLENGCVTLSSRGGALPEAGADLVDYFDTTDCASLAGLVRDYLDEPTRLTMAQSRIDRLNVPRWDETAARLAELAGTLLLDNSLDPGGH